MMNNQMNNQMSKEEIIKHIHKKIKEKTLEINALQDVLSAINYDQIEHTPLIHEPKARMTGYISKPWTTDEEDALIYMYSKHIPMKDIMKKLRRTKNAITGRSRIIKTRNKKK